MPARKPKPVPAPGHPVLQWAMATLGLTVTVGVVAAILWEAMLPDGPPALSARILHVETTPLGHVAEVQVTNAGLDTAAAVDIEGRVGSETATATLDYVPGRGHAVAWLRFDTDPRVAQVIVKGWSAP